MHNRNEVSQKGPPYKYSHYQNSNNTIPAFPNAVPLYSCLIDGVQNSHDLVVQKRSQAGRSPLLSLND